MSLSLRWWALWIAILGAPLAFFLTMLAVPEWDRSFGTSNFHFYVVSGTALAAAIACAVIVSLTESLRETRLVFLGLAFLSIAAIFAVHGLGTPGHIHEVATAPMRASSWVSVFAGALFCALSVVTLPSGAEDWLKRYGGIVFSFAALALGVYVGLSTAMDEWLNWLPIEDRALQLGMTAVTLSLLAFGAWRYFQAFLFARLPSQWVMVCVLVLLMEVQVSLTWGRYWQASWWLYHGTYGAAFLVLFAGWYVEARRAGSLRVIAEALSMRDAMAQLNRGYSQPISDLVDAIEWKDIYTLGHVRRVASYAVMTGKELGMSPLELRALALAAQMHDVGKLGVPDRILTKAGQLTPEEFDIIRQHAFRGYEIAMGVPALHAAVDGIRYHHERFDGAGYPEGLIGETIPLQARIVAVADAFDAMTSGRVYQPAVSNGAAIAELEQCAGSHFDPRCVHAFSRVISRLGDVSEDHHAALAHDHSHGLAA
ncbi:MAG: HD domain-containing protein [Dehalococcoidia bacterium]|nr:HD domain-containing protein [Dehalococcoidia bacterium]